MTTTFEPIPAHVGTFLVQMGAVSVVDQYRAGTLPPTMRRFVDTTIRQCELQGDNAQRWVDGVVELSVHAWAEAQDADDSVHEAEEHDDRVLHPRRLHALVRDAASRLISVLAASGRIMIWISRSAPSRSGNRMPLSTNPSRS